MADSYSYKKDEQECVQELQDLYVNKPPIKATKFFPLNYQISSGSNNSKVSQSTSNVRIINSAIFIESTNNGSAPNEIPAGSIQSRSTTFIKHKNVPESRSSTSENKAGNNGYVNGPSYSPVEFSKCMVHYGKDSEIGAGEVAMGAVCKESLGALAWHKWYENKEKQQKQQRAKQREEEKLKQIKLREVQYEKQIKDTMERSNREAWLKRKEEEQQAKKKLLSKKQAAKHQSKTTSEMSRSQSEELYRKWLMEKEQRRQEQVNIKEKELKLKQQTKIERQEKSSKAFKEWLVRTANSPKPMAPIIYDAKRHDHVHRQDMFWNPNPWQND